VFTSLPRSGTVRAATLLAAIGDARGRFPTEDALAAAAGISLPPPTRASGRSRYVAFRRGCNRRLRQALVDFADGSRQGNPWAQDIYARARARARGFNHAHAIRVLARAWLRIIWRCWTDHSPYDPARHLAAVAARHPRTGRPEPTPAAC
jgi:transposase